MTTDDDGKTGGQVVPEFKLENWFKRFEHSVKYSLCSSDAESLTVGDLLNLKPNGIQDLLSIKLTYGEKPGALSLRRAISQHYYDSRIPASNILIHVGGEEPIHNYLTAVVDPASYHVVAMWPSYQSVASIPVFRGCPMDKWRLHFDPEKKEWGMNFDELEVLLQKWPEKKKVLYINLPHNPTGFVFTKEEYTRVFEVTNKYAAVVFSDEVYRGLELDEQYVLESACLVDEKAISMNAISKAAGLPGLRLGWIATRDPVALNLLAQYKNFTTVSPPTPCEYLATIAIENRASIEARNRAICLANLELARSFFRQQSSRLEWVEPRGGHLIFARLVGAGKEGSERQLEQWARDDGVLLLPGSYLGEEYGEFFRFSLGRKDLREGLEYFGKVLQKQC